MDSAEVKIDGGSWQSSPTVISGDGTHQVSFRASDVAGNQSSVDDDTVRIDGTAPHSAFRTPEEGSDTWNSGEYTFVGKSSDATSGLAALELSLNGGSNWQDLGHSGGDWDYSWHTRLVPNGSYVILAHARDTAGIRESTAHVTVRVDNAAPTVDIPESWMLGECAPLTVTEQGIGLDRVEIQIATADSTLLQQGYQAGQLPTSVDWDGQHPDGQPAAPGEYLVTAVAWDLAGNRGSDSGLLSILAIAPEDDPPPAEDTTPTEEAPPIDISVVVNRRSRPGAPQDLMGGVPGAEGITPLASSLTTRAQALNLRRIWIWPAFAWAGLLVALGYAKLADPRPDALRGLRADLHRIRKLQQYVHNSHCGRGWPPSNRGKGSCSTSPWR